MENMCILEKQLHYPAVHYHKSTYDGGENNKVKHFGAYHMFTIKRDK